MKTKQTYERKIEKLFSRVFLKQGSRLAQEVETLRVNEGYKETFGLLLTTASLPVRSLFDTFIHDTVQLGITHLLEQVQIDLSFDLFSAPGLRFLETYGLERLRQIDEESRQRALGVLEKGIEEGQTYTVLAKSIRGLFKDMSVKRSKLIAVTEVGQAYEAGQQVLTENLTTSGLEMEKRWLTSRDRKVTIECTANANEGWVAATATFPSGHMHPLRFPGCRCTCQYRVKV